MHPLKFTPWIFCLLLHLLLRMSGHVVGENFAATEQNQEGNHHHHQVHSTSSTPHYVDHSVLVFFTPKDLKAENVIPIFFRATKHASSSSSTTPHFIPREEADEIPFSFSKLPYLLQLFGFSQTSSQAKAMEETLRHCETEPILGETKFCATSLESMIDFVHGTFGLNTKFKALSTHEYGKSGNLLQNYTILNEPREVVAPKMVACHTMPYPYVVYYCHHQKSESRVFQVSLRGENRINTNNINIVEAVAVCHMDTSEWSPNHVSFRVLGTKPGSSPICHFFPADNVVWVPIFETTQIKSKNSADKVSSM